MIYTKDWRDFSKERSWFNHANNPVTIDGPYHAPNSAFRPTEAFRHKFPKLTTLLSSARVTFVMKEQQLYHLYGWTTVDNHSLGWLCPPPSGTTCYPEFLHPDHHLLLGCFGGIIEQWNLPETSWLLNLDSALCEREAQIGFGHWEEYYRRLCTEDNLQPIFALPEYVSFAFEANGNRTAYHRQDASVVLFAHDHYFDHIDPLPDVPEYTFYTIRECPDLQTWIETVAQQHLAVITPENHEPHQAARGGI